MKEKILLIWKHLKQGTMKKMWKQTLWIYQYGRRYWKAMILYTLLGLVGTGVSLVSSLISRDLVDIITGHQTGKLISTFAAMIGFSVANILVSQASGYASTFINLKVDSEIRCLQYFKRNPELDSQPDHLYFSFYQCTGNRALL